MCSGRDLGYQLAVLIIDFLRFELWIRNDTNWHLNNEDIDVLSSQYIIRIVSRAIGVSWQGERERGLEE